MTKLTEQVSDTKPMLSERMRADADARYCRMVNRALSDPLTKGEEHKLTHGQFGKDELKAHREQARLDAGYRALHEYATEVAALEQSLAQRTADLGKYGRCLSGCNSVQQREMVNYLFPCTCGFAKAMEQQP